MKVAFYRGDQSLFSRITRWWTGTVTLEGGRVVGPFTHAELIFSDGIWFSADERDRGVRFKRVRLAMDDDRWLLVDLPLTDEQEAKIFSRAKKINRLGYDKLGVLKAAWRPARESPDRYFCSECCLYCLQGAGLFPGAEPCRTTPVDLAALVLAVFGKATY